MREKIENMPMEEFVKLCNRLVVEMGFKVRNSVYREDTAVFDAYMPVPGKSLHYVIIFLKRPKVTMNDIMEMLDVETVEVRWMFITTGKFEGVEELKNREDVTLLDWNDFERLIVEFGLKEELTRGERGAEAREGRYLPSAGELESMLQWARDFLEQENYEKALEYVDRALGIKVTSEGRKLKARILAATGRVEEAISILTSILENDIRDDEAWLILGQVLEDSGDLEESSEAYSQCVRFNPRNLTCWMNRGNVMLRLEKYSEALLCYEKALEIRRDIPALWNNRGVALKYLGKYDEALRSYNVALKMDKDFADAYLNKAILYFETRKYEKARNEVEEYLKRRRDSRALLLLARIYIRRGMKKDAREIIEEVLQMEPGNTEARELIDRLEGRTREVKEYQELREKLKKEASAIEETYGKVMNSGEKDELNRINEDIERGEISSAYARITNLKDKLNSREIETLKNVLRKNTARLLELAGMDVPENIEELEVKELEILGEEAVRRKELSEYGGYEGNSKALAHLFYEESLWEQLKNMDVAYALNALGLRYLKSRKYSLALEHFLEAWSKEPSFKEAELNLAYAYFKKGELRRARALLKHLGMEELLKKWEKD